MSWKIDSLPTDGVDDEDLRNYKTHVVRGNAHHHAAAMASVIGTSLEDNYQRWSDAIKWHKRDVKHQKHWSFGAPDTKGRRPEAEAAKGHHRIGECYRNLMEEAAEEDGDDAEKCYEKSKRAHERQLELGRSLDSVCRDEGLKVQCEAWTCPASSTPRARSCSSRSRPTRASRRAARTRCSSRSCASST